MGTFIADGSTVLPGVKSDARPATIPPAADEWCATDANQVRTALLDCRSSIVSAVSFNHEIALYYGSVLTDGLIVLSYVFGRAVTWPSGLAGSRFKAIAASTGTAVMTIEKNGVQIGTVTFTASALGVAAMASAQTWAAGDVLTVTGPLTADASLGGLTFTFVGTRA